jgi:phage terminase large subunit-like protein
MTIPQDRNLRWSLDFVADALVSGRCFRIMTLVDDAAPNNMTLDGDKVMLITPQVAQFYAGSVHFPETAPWLDELLAELFAFPHVKHDDQVDSISQALGYINWIESTRIRFGSVVGTY